MFPTFVTVFGATIAVKPELSSSGGPPPIPTTLNLVPSSEMYPFPLASTNGGITTRPLRLLLSFVAVSVLQNVLTIIVRFVVSGALYLIPVVNSAALLTLPSG